VFDPVGAVKGIGPALFNYLSGLMASTPARISAAARDESRAKKRAKAESKSWGPLLVKRWDLDRLAAEVEKTKICPTCGQARSL
jgi:hypothetical protein